MPLSSFDFQQARVKQVLFKSRLRSVLYGVREAEPTLFSYSDNPVGQWIQTALRPELGHLPAVHELERTVQHMLRTGQELASRYQRGQIEEARTGLEEINTYSDHIEKQLANLEAAVH